MVITDKDIAVCNVFHELKNEVEALDKKQFSLGYGQRNALYDHINSGYVQHYKLADAVTKWEKNGVRYRVLKGLFDILRVYRDLYGYFPEYKKMMAEFDSVLNFAAEKEEFEIAQILKEWRDKFPDP